MSLMNSLKVPYGRTLDSALVAAAEANPSLEYSCPACNAKLVLRDGENRCKHFSHPSLADCNQETILHRTAKVLIASVIQDNAAGGNAIALSCICDCCHKRRDIQLPPRTFSGAYVEMAVGEYVCDVVGERAGKDALAIEVLVTHRVESHKGEQLSLPWIELAAGDVIVNPRAWNPLQANIKPVRCDECKARIARVHDVADRWSIDRSLYSPLERRGSAAYVAAVEHCFKCKEDIPVFWWNGVPFCESSPPEPRPATIKNRHSKQYGDAYWANTCANCGALQGDNHLYILKGAVLGHLPLTDKAQKQSSAAAVSAFKKIINKNFGYE